MILFSFIKVIMPQSEAHTLQGLSKIGRKVIEYAYVSGQYKQTISVPMANIWSVRYNS